PYTTPLPTRRSYYLSRSAVWRRVAGSCVDDGEIPHDPDLDVVRLEIGNPDGQCRLPEETLPIGQRPIRVGAQKVVRQDLVEAARIRCLHRSDVVAVEI